MLIAWMIYAVLLTALIYGAGLACGRVVAMWRGAERYVWLGALAAATIVPVVLATRRVPLTPMIASASSSAVATKMSTIPASGIAYDVRASLRELMNLVLGRLGFGGVADSVARDVWLVASAIALGFYLVAFGHLRRKRAQWEEVAFEGDRVLVAPDVGPAVVGVVDPRVVLPKWALSLNATELDLMLRHEAEHIDASDPAMLFSAAIATVIFPWNPALWALVGRLRLAIEVDCDRRVLGVSGLQQEYGNLLIAVAARRAGWLPLATRLAERRPQLERRLVAITAPPTRNRMAVSVAFGAVALAVTSIAWSAPQPSSLRTPRRYSGDDIRALPSVVVGDSVRTVAPTSEQIAPTQSLESIRAMITEHNPAVLADSSVAVNITLVLDAAGKYVYSVAVKNFPGDPMHSWYFFEARVTQDGEHMLYLDDMTPLGVAQSMVDYDLAHNEFAPRVAGLKVISLKPKAN